MNRNIRRAASERPRTLLVRALPPVIGAVVFAAGFYILFDVSWWAAALYAVAAVVSSAVLRVDWTAIRREPGPNELGEENGPG
jgi:hypothetical protein